MVSKSVKSVEQSYKSASNAPDRDNRLHLVVVEDGPGPWCLHNHLGGARFSCARVKQLGCSFQNIGAWRSR
jgi:hypothetical protein